MAQSIYVDNNATTQVDERVARAMAPYECECFGNPNSLHDYGARARDGLRVALDHVYAALNAADADDMLITGCATEANNTVLKALLRRRKNASTGAYELCGDAQGRTHVVTSAVEHPSVRATCEYLETQGVEVTVVSVGAEGVVTPEILRAAVVPGKTALVSIMWANNETGLINPIKELAAVAHEAGALFHTDAVQAVGKLHVDVQDAGVDMLTLSAHKFHGPKGVGALYVRAGCGWFTSEGWFVPLLHGGEQMAGRRAGTLNVAGIVGMGKALEIAASAEAKAAWARVRVMRDRLEDGLLSIAGVEVIGQRELRTPNTILASFRGVEGEAMLWDLNRAGIAASTGSACASESLQANPTFVAMSVDPELSHTGVRFSLSRFTTDIEVDTVLRAVRDAVARLRSISGQK
jgi:cysteine desulfurase